MAIYRYNDGGEWQVMANIYRYNDNGEWLPMNAIYRYDDNSIWRVIYLRNENLPSVSVAPTLTDQFGSETSFTQNSTITLNRGTWRNTGSTFTPVYYNLTIQRKTDSDTTWTNVTPTSFTPANPVGTTGYNNYQTVSYALTLTDVRDPSYLYRGRVNVKNDVGEGITYFTTPIRSYMDLSVSTPTVTVYGDRIVVDWTTTPTNSSSNIDAQEVEIITDTGYTYNGNTFSAYDTVYTTTVTPGTGQVTIYLSGTNIRPNSSFYASVTVTANDTDQTVAFNTSNVFTTLASAYSFAIGNTIYPSTNGFISFDAGSSSTSIPSTNRHLSIYPHDLQYSDIRVWSNGMSPTASTQYVVYYDAYQYGQVGVSSYRLRYMAKFYTDQSYVDVKILTRGSNLTGAKTIGIYSNGTVYSGVAGPYTLSSGTTFRVYYSQSSSSVTGISFTEIPTGAMSVLGSPTTGLADDGYWSITTASNIYNPPGYSARTLNSKTATTISYDVTGTNNYTKTKWVARTSSHSGTIAASGTYSTDTTSVVLTGLSANTLYYITFTPVNSLDQDGSAVQFTEQTNQAIAGITELIQKRTDVGFLTMFYTASPDTQIDNIRAYASRFYTPDLQNQTTTSLDWSTTQPNVRTEDGGVARGWYYVYVGGYSDYASSSYRWNSYAIPIRGSEVGNAVNMLAQPPNSTTDAPTVSLGTLSNGNASFSRTVTFGGAANRYTIDVKTTSYNGTSISGFPKQNQSGNISVSGLTNGTTYYVTITPYYYYYIDSDHTESDPSNSVRFAGSVSTFTAAPVAPLNPPGSPSNVSGSGATSSSIDWTWDAPTTGGTVSDYRWAITTTTTEPADSSFADLGSTTRSKTTSSLTASTSYYFWVKAKNADGNSSAVRNSTAVSTTAAASKPGTPTSLSATTNLSDKVTLTFSGSSGADSYDIYWYPNDSYRPPDTAGADFQGISSPYDDTGISAGTSRWYFVRGRNDQGTSTWYPTSFPGVKGTRTSGGGGGGGSAPAKISLTGNNSLAVGGTFSWSFSGSPTGYSVFVTGPTGTVYTTSNAYTYTGTTFRPGYDGTGWQGAGTYTIYISATNANGSSPVETLDQYMS